MKLIVQKYVYARVGKPSTKVPFAGYRSPGESLTIDDIETGTDIGGNSVWYHCADDGAYYWSGAFPETEELLGVRRNGNNFSHEEQIEIYKSAANELASKYRFVPNYKGIAAGYKVIEQQGITEDRLALIIYVGIKVPATQAKVEPTINYRGISLITDVKVIQLATLHNIADATRPYQMGGRLSGTDINNIEIEDGTRALIVKRGEKRYLLACYHVACRYLFRINRFEFKQEKLNVHTPPKIPAINSPTISGKVVEGQFGSTCDYALIDIETTDFTNRIPGFAFNNGYYDAADLKTLNKNSRLIMYGGESGQQTAFFQDYHVAEVDLGGGIKMSGLISTGKLSIPGDSGAPVIDDNNKFVGIVIGGDGKNISYILPIAQLEFDFHFSPDL